MCTNCQAIPTTPCPLLFSICLCSASIKCETIRNQTLETHHHHCKHTINLLLFFIIIGVILRTLLNARSNNSSSEKKSHETHKLRRSYGTISHTEKNAVRNRMGVNIYHRLICCERLMLLLCFFHAFSLFYFMHDDGKARRTSRPIFRLAILCSCVSQDTRTVCLRVSMCVCVCTENVCRGRVAGWRWTTCLMRRMYIFVGFMNEMRILP